MHCIYIDMGLTFCGSSIRPQLLATCVIVLLQSSGLRAQQSQKFTLPEAMKAASEQNKLAEIARRKVTVSNESVRITSDKKLPDLRINGDYSRVTNLTEWHDGYRDGVHYHIIPEIYDASATLSMPLYAGGKLRYQKEIAELSAEKQLIELEKTQSDLQLKTASAFISLYKHLQLQHFLNETIREERVRLKEIESKYRHGVVTKNEVLRANLLISERRQDSISNARETDVLNDALRIFVDLPESQKFEADTTQIASIGKEVEALKDVSENHELHLAGKHLTLAEKEIDLAKSANYPTIGFFGNYGLRYPNTLFFPQHPFPYTLGQIGIQLEWNVTDLWKNRRKISVARQNAGIAEIEKEELEEQLEHQLLALEKEKSELEQRILLSSESVASARENFRIVRARYLKQMILISEMTDADNALIDARYRHASNRADLILNRILIQHLKGKL